MMFAVLLVLNIYLVYNHYFELDFIKVTDYTSDFKTSKSQNLYWFSLSNGGCFTKETLDRYGVDLDFEPDYSKYTYIVTVGYKLNDISYSLNARKNHVQFIGKVILDDEFTNKIYIYRVKRMNIDCDYHERDRNVYFVKNS